MASPGLLFLLMVSSSLLLSGLSAPSSNQPPLGPTVHIKEKDKQEIITGTLKTRKFLIDHAAFINLLPWGKKINEALIKNTEIVLSRFGVTVEDGISKLIKAESENLNLKIDFVQSKWDTIEGDFNKLQNEIKDAWKEYEDLFKILSDPKNDKRQNLENRFKEFYGKIVLQVKALHNLLKYSDPTSHQGEFNKFGEIMAKHVRCHNKEIDLFTLHTSTLLYKGNIMSHYFDKLQNMDKLDDLVKNTFDSRRTLYQIQEYCISNFMDYIKDDIEDLIKNLEKEKKSREEQAHDIRMFLEETHDKYNWMVVVFFTKNSDNIFLLNMHTIEGFTTFPVGGATVAIAKQVKGTYTMAKKVSPKIEECIKAHESKHKLISLPIMCEDIPKILNECSLTVDTHKLSDTITAIHAFLNENEGSTSAEEIPEEYHDYESQAPYIVKGECEIGNGEKSRFIVLIKSDEELGGEKVICKDMKCGPGKCEVVKDTAIPVCKCDEHHSGVNCGMSFDGYKQLIQSPKMPII